MKKKVNNFRKIIVLAIATTMSLSLIACGEKQTDETGAIEGENLSGNYDEQLSISLAVLDNVTDEQWENDFHKYFEDKFNIDWDYNYVEWGSWAEKLRVWINANDLPDVSIWDYNYTDAKDYVEQDLLYKFPDDWKEKWPNVAKAYEASPLNLELEEQFGGTYVLLRPIFVNHSLTNPPVNQVGVIGIRKDWAEAVGFELKDAYTIDEMFEYARLVKEQDPGALGDKLIPICFDPANSLTSFVSATSNHGRLETAFYQGDDGTYQWGGADQETLEGLKLYQQAYNEGLLDQEFFQLNDNDKEKFYVNGTVAVYHMGGVADFRQTVDTEMRTNLGVTSDDVVHEAILLGNDEKYHNIVLGSNYWSSLILSPDITDENFNRFMDFLDYTCTDEGQNIVNMGFEGVDWEVNENGEAVSILEGMSVTEKYGPRIESLYILEDDFAVINPAIKAEYRDRMKTLAEAKLEYGEGEYSEIDWNVELNSSREKNQAQLDYATEYANLILKDGDLETNWNEWVNSKMSVIQPYIDVLNEGVTE
ncbi:MAG: extracellular solute-binding protein [Lachnospirales bacterium]